MSNQKSSKKTHLRQRRVFSEDFKKQAVKDIELGKCTVLQASREYDINQQTVYNWLYKHSRYLKKNSVLIVEKQSEQYKRKELEQKIKDVEAALGRKQMEIDMLNKIIDLANAEYQTDLKKNISKIHSNGLGLTKELNTNTP
jgi:transposase-like protein